MIPFSKLQFEAELLDNHAPRGFWGTRLRGGYGTALRQAYCTEEWRAECPGYKHNGDEIPACERFLEKDCDFPFLFKPHIDLLAEPPTGRPLGGYQNLPPPFVFSVPNEIDVDLLRGSRITFDLVAFGPTVSRIMRAIESIGLLGHNGIDVKLRSGRLERSQFRLLDLKDLLAGGRSLYTAGNVGTPLVVDSANYVHTLSRGSEPGEIVIEFVTPVTTYARGFPELRGASKRSDGKTAAMVSDFYELTRLIIDRVAGLWQVYGNDWPGQGDYFRWRNALLAHSRQIEIVEMELRCKRIERFSRTQSKPVIMEGFVGAVRAKGPVGPLLELLLLGELFHIGESTAYGFGQFKVAV